MLKILQCVKKTLRDQQNKWILLTFLTSRYKLLVGKHDKYASSVSLSAQNIIIYKHFCGHKYNSLQGGAKTCTLSFLQYLHQADLQQNGNVTAHLSW